MRLVRASRQEDTRKLGSRVFQKVYCLWCELLRDGPPRSASEEGKRGVNGGMGNGRVEEETEVDEKK